MKVWNLHYACWFSRIAAVIALELREEVNELKQAVESQMQELLQVLKNSQGLINCELTVSKFYNLWELWYLEFVWDAHNFHKFNKYDNSGW